MHEAFYEVLRFTKRPAISLILSEVPKVKSLWPVAIENKIYSKRVHC